MRRKNISKRQRKSGNKVQLHLERLRLRLQSGPNMISKWSVVFSLLVAIIINHFMRNQKGGQARALYDVVSLIRNASSTEDRSKTTEQLLGKLGELLSQLAGNIQV